MRITLIMIGSKMPNWVEEGAKDYTKRLQGLVDFKIQQLPLGKRSKSTSVEKAIQSEGDAMLQTIPEKDFVIALEVKGKSWSTEELTSKIADWQMSGDNITLLVGGPDGLDPRCSSRANIKWSLSNLTLPHPLVKVLLCEQIYRAFSILNNHPYHRA